MKHGPEHIFGNILESVPTRYRKACGLGDGQELPADRLRAVLPRAKPRLTIYCYKCNKECTMTKTDSHTAGSSCVDFSPGG